MIYRLDNLIENNKQVPLAELMRPKKLEEYLDSVDKSENQINYI